MPALRKILTSISAILRSLLRIIDVTDVCRFEVMPFAELIQKVFSDRDTSKWVLMI